MGVALKDVSLDDKYDVEIGRIFVTGIQALVRLPMMQQARDKAAGHRTARPELVRGLVLGDGPGLAGGSPGPGSGTW